MKLKVAIAAMTTLAMASPALADRHMPKPGMKPMAGMMMKDPGNPYQSAEMDMHMKMMAAKSGDASEKWTRKMIEHHRGALAMSRVALIQASDADTKRMAQMTIDMQEKDVAELQGWLKSHGKPAQ